MFYNMGCGPSKFSYKILHLNFPNTPEIFSEREATWNYLKRRTPRENNCWHHFRSCELMLYIHVVNCYLCKWSVFDCIITLCGPMLKNARFHLNPSPIKFSLEFVKRASLGVCLSNFSIRYWIKATFVHLFEFLNVYGLFSRSLFYRLSSSTCWSCFCFFINHTQIALIFHHFHFW